MKMNFTLNPKKQIVETMEDYIRWRGDLSFQDVPFNVIDNMIFCELSYVDFSKVMQEDSKDGISLKQCGERITDENCYSLRNLYGGHEDFFQAVCQSKRFGSILINHYEDIFEESEQVQFSALEFLIDPKTSYIAYRGTDNSLVGWKEDFMISFTRIKAQDYSTQYLQKVWQNDHSYYIGGHSKGGNLALFAAAQLSPEQLKQVLRIYDNDGPGFCPEMFDLKKLEPLKDLVTRIIPDFCVIGKIFEVTFPDTHIVRSTETGANQHDIISWQINGIELEELEENDKVSEWIDKSVASWVNDATFEERQTFVNEFFNSLAAGGATTMQEVFGKGILEVAKAMAAASPTSKKLVANLAEVALLGEKK